MPTLLLLFAGAAFGQAPADRPATPAVTEIQKLVKFLPPDFETQDTYGLAKDGGIVTDREVRITSKSNEFLAKEYVFDIWLKIGMTGDAAVIGIGNGKVEQSLCVMIRPPDDGHRGAFLSRGDGWGEKIADLFDAGEYVVRVERHGSSMTFSFGAEKDGKLAFFGSTTVPSPKGVMPKLDEQSARLFFGGAATFRQYRLAMMPATEPITPKPGSIIPLTRDLTPQLMANDAFTAPPTGGVVPRKHGYFLTRDANFLDADKDYLFDVWVKLERKGGWSIVGIGDGTPERSIELSLRPADEQHHGVALTRGDVWGKGLADIRDAGVYIARIEKRGGTMIFSVGTEKDGWFVPLCAETVADPRAMQPKLSDRNARLHFGGSNHYLKYRLVMGSEAQAAATASFTGQPASLRPPALRPPAMTPPNATATPAAAPPKTPPTTPPAVATPKPPVVPPPTPAPSPPVASNGPAAPPAVPVAPKPPAMPADAQRFMPVGTLASKAAPKLAAGAGRIHFTAPQHDKFWKGANGVVLPAGATWAQVGTVWKCDQFQPKPWGITFIHPLGDGHVLIEVGDNGVQFRDDGKWVSRKGWKGVPLHADFPGKFPLDKEAVHTLQSQLSSAGDYRLFVDGKLCATAKFTVAKPLTFDEDFKGTNLPKTLGRGFAGVIVQNSYRMVTTAGDLSLAPE